MNCPKCGSNNVNLQVINESKLVKAHHNVIWWLLIGWWWIPLKWICFFWVALIFKIFGVGKKNKIKNTTKKVCVCQNCGNTWNA